MRRFLSALCLVIAVLLITGCGDSHKSVANDFIAQMEKATEALETVEDAKSAEKASDKLTAIADRIDEINNRADELGTPSRTDKRAIQDELEGRIKDMQDDFEEQMSRILKLDDYYEDIREPLEEGLADIVDAEPKDLEWIFD